MFVVAIGALLRCWQLGSVGYNSDEAVYAGQAASIAGQPDYLPYFPIFRAHPLLFQSLLSLSFHFSVSDIVGRLLSAAFGTATLFVVYLLGQRLLGRATGLVASLLTRGDALPCHRHRQVLLDGPMVFFATAALYLLVRYCRDPATDCSLLLPARWVSPCSPRRQLVVLMGGAYCFFMLSLRIRVRIRLVAVCLAVFFIVVSGFPLALRLAGASRSGGKLPGMATVPQSKSHSWLLPHHGPGGHRAWAVADCGRRTICRSA